MKCPRCGYWNKPSFPHCFKCGEPLSQGAGTAADWRKQFEAPPPEKKRIVFDDTVAPVEDVSAEEAPAPPPIIKRAGRRSKQGAAASPDRLATEMSSLKERRERGNAYLQEFRQKAADKGIAPSGAGVSVRRSGGFYTDIPDNPDETVQIIETEYDEDGLPVSPAGAPAPRQRYTPPRREREPADPDLGVNPFAEYDSDMPPAYDAQPVIAPYQGKKRRFRRVRGPMLLAYCTVGILVLALIAFGVYATYTFIIPEATLRRAAVEKLENVKITPITMEDGLAGHRIEVAGEEGTLIYIGEQRKSYVVVGGVATIEIADHTFYDMIEPLDQSMETMEVTLSPSVLRNSTETRMEAIRYTIDIPLSEIKLVRPEIQEIEVNASMYNMELEVTPGSRVIANGIDISDTVKENGRVSYNPPVRAIGDNVIVVTVRAPYCRENTMKIVLYRKPMEITLELDAATVMSTSSKELTIYGTTQIDATVSIDSPASGIDVSEVPTNGKFNVTAKMTRVGINKVIIRASMEGKEDAMIEHEVYYLPPADEYTRKAWALAASDYSELMNNIALRIENAQIYLCLGTIVRSVSTNPQLVIMNTGTEEKEQLVLLENGTTDNSFWEVGKKYRIFADVSGVYNNMPRLMGRYSYRIQEEPADATAAPTQTPTPPEDELTDDPTTTEDSGT